MECAVQEKDANVGSHDNKQTVGGDVSSDLGNVTVGAYVLLHDTDVQDVVSDDHAQRVCHYASSEKLATEASLRIYYEIFVASHGPNIA